MSGLKLRSPQPGYCCPYCGSPIGYVGRAISALFGVRSHGCDFSNVMPPPPAKDEVWLCIVEETATGAVLGSDYAERRVREDKFRRYDSARAIMKQNIATDAGLGEGWS